MKISLYRFFTQKSFLIYLVVGLISFSCEYAIFLVLYYLAHSGIVVSNFTSILVAFLVNFSLNKIWTYKGEHILETHKQILRYAVLVAFNFIFSTLVIAISKRLGLPPYAAKLLAMGMIVLWNYLILRKLIFHTEAESAG